MNYPPLAPPFKVLIVDDHKFLVELLAQRLANESQIEIVGMANNGDNAVHIVSNQEVDVVLLDMAFDGEDGIHLARRLLKLRRSLRIIGLSMLDSDHHPLSLLEIGGVGYLSKSATGREIIEGVKRVAAGEMAISPKVAVHLATQCKNPSPIDQVRTLSRKETQVFRLIAKGLGIQEIAKICGVVDKTIQSHRARLRKKLGVSNDVELCLLALKSGLISIQD